MGNGNGGVAGAGLEVQHIAEGGLRRQVGVRGDKALLVGLDAADHIGLLLNGLGAVDEGDAALLGQGNRQLLTGDRLHDGGDHRDVHFQRAGFLALAVLDQRGFQADSRRNTLGGRISGDKQVFTKSTGRFGKIISHSHTLLTSCLHHILERLYHNHGQNTKPFCGNLSCTVKRKLGQIAPKSFPKV